MTHPLPTETSHGDWPAAETVLEQITAKYQAPKWLLAHRRRALEAFRSMPLPDQVTHLWRYTDPGLFMPTDNHQAPTPPGGDTPRAFPELIESALASDSVAGASYSRNGTVMKIALEDHLAAAGVKLMDLHDAAREHPDLIEKHLGSLVGPEFGKFEALSNALWTGGLLVYVPRGVDVAKPIHIVSGPADDGGHLIQRLLVIVEENASLTLIDEHGEDRHSKDTTQTKTLVELVLGSRARVTYATIQNWGRNTISYMTHRARLARDAHLDTVVTSLGSGTAKIDCGAVLAERGAESNIYGLAIGTGTQHFDHHTAHTHEAGWTMSDLKFKVALREKASSVYTGLIRIDANAPFCEAYQENRNLLLSPNAQAETIPELEILTNEVRCSHGATVGKVNPDEIFYLESRGIPPREAMHLIVTGFVTPILDHLPEVARNRIHGVVLGRLGDVET